MNKIIFLDIDGVLNSNQYWKSLHEKGEKQYPVRMEFELDPKCLRNLKKIVDETGAKIVITSTWKKLPKKMEMFKEYISKNGLFVYDQTPCHPEGAGNRGEEIRQYLNEHKGQVEKFIVLDDDIFPDFNELTQYLIKTSFYKNGLCQNHVTEAIKRLEKIKKEQEMER